MAVLLQLQSDGLVYSWVDDQGALRWALTDAGKASSAADSAVTTWTSVAVQHHVNRVLVEDVVCPDAAGKLVVDIGPGVRMRLGRGSVLTG